MQRATVGGRRRLVSSQVSNLFLFQRVFAMIACCCSPRFATRRTTLTYALTRPARRRTDWQQLTRMFLASSSSLDPAFSTTPASKLDVAATVGYEKLFDVNLPEGRCVGIRVGQLGASRNDQTDEKQGTRSSSTAPSKTLACWVHESLHPDEVQFATQLASNTSQKSFIGGRLALRHAMECHVQDCVILKDAHGRPQIPPSFVGSVSHKGDVAVALVAPTTTSTMISSERRNWAIGVDLELRQKGHKRIARRILTPDERANLGLLNNVDADEEVLLRFSVKEALYKATHPLICQYVGFQEAETQPLADGTVQVDLNIRSGAHKEFESVTAHWRILDDYFLTSGRVRLKPGVQPRNHDVSPEECRL